MKQNGAKQNLHLHLSTVHNLGPIYKRDKMQFWYISRPTIPWMWHTCKTKISVLLEDLLPSNPRFFPNILSNISQLLVNALRGNIKTFCLIMRVFIGNQYRYALTCRWANNHRICTKVIWVFASQPLRLFTCIFESYLQGIISVSSIMLNEET